MLGRPRCETNTASTWRLRPESSRASIPCTDSSHLRGFLTGPCHMLCYGKACQACHQAGAETVNHHAVHCRSQQYTPSQCLHPVVFACTACALLQLTLSGCC